MSPIAAALLAAYGIEFVVVGGCALVLLGRATDCGDLDIVPEPSRPNMQRLRSALTEIGARSGSDSVTALERPLTSFTSPYGRIDVLFERGQLEYDSLAGHAMCCPVEDAQVLVASAEDVLELRARFREVDQ